MKNKPTKHLVQTSLFVALAIVVRQFSVMIPFGGSNGMRIGVSEVFTKMPALLFGPFLGGIASGLVDWLSQVIKAEGAYLLPMLFVMILGGAITGFAWRFFKKIPSDKLRAGFLSVCAVCAIIGILNSVILTFEIHGFWFNALMGLGKSIGFSTYGMILVAVFGMIFLGVDFLIMKKSEDNYDGGFLQLALTVFLSDIVVTTLNTFILRHYYTGLAKIPFLAYYIPRVIQDMITTVIFAYILSVLLKIYHKVIK